MTETTLIPSRVADRMVPGVIAGSLLAATTIGMLFGMGRRHSTLWRPLNAAAHTILGAQADGVWGFQADVTAAGVGVVLVVSAAAGFAVAALATSRRVLFAVLAAVGVAVAGYLTHVHVVARSPGGLAALLTIGELRALYVTGAIALFAGMRYAFSPVARHR